MTKDKIQQWRARLIKIGKSFPEVDASGDQHVAFKVHGKAFAHFLVESPLAMGR